ncbi:hypothetical protein EMIT0P43_30242 [Pseudomonas jessenii]
MLEPIRQGGAGLSSERSTKYLFNNQIGDISTMLGDGCGHTLSAVVVVDCKVAKTKLSNGSLVWRGPYGHS